MKAAVELQRAFTFSPGADNRSVKAALVLHWTQEGLGAQQREASLGEGSLGAATRQEGP